MSAERSVERANTGNEPFFTHEASNDSANDIQQWRPPSAETWGVRSLCSGDCTEPTKGGLWMSEGDVELGLCVGCFIQKFGKSGRDIAMHWLTDRRTNALKAFTECPSDMLARVIFLSDAVLESFMTRTFHENLSQEDPHAFPSGLQTGATRCRVDLEDGELRSEDEAKFPSVKERESLPIEGIELPTANNWLQPFESRHMTFGISSQCGGCETMTSLGVWPSTKRIGPQGNKRKFIRDDVKSRGHWCLLQQVPEFEKRMDSYINRLKRRDDLSATCHTEIIATEKSFQRWLSMTANEVDTKGSCATAEELAFAEMRSEAGRPPAAAE